MKYLWYAFLGLFSLGCLGFLASVALLFGLFRYYGTNLPEYHQLKEYEPSIITRIYAGDGRLMAEFAQEKRVFMPVETIPNLLKQAFISAEDKNFYSHQGVDPTAIARAVVTNITNLGRGRRPVGASTITQQVAKNFLLTNEVSYERKIKEAILAYRMEQALTKDQLLELYLNEIFLGYRAYGVAAAAQQYFNKSLDELTIADMAYLAALPKAPNNYHPIRKREAAVTRRNWVIGRMLEDGYITPAQADLAKTAPLEVIKREEERVVRAPFFAEEVRRELKDRYGEKSLYGGGLAVRTTVDPSLQKIAEKSLREGLMAYDQRHGYRGPVKTGVGIQEWGFNEMTRPNGMLNHWKLALVIDVGEDAAIKFEDSSEGTIALEDLKWARKYLNEGYARGPEITAASDALSKGDVVMVAPLEDQDNTYGLRQIPDVQGSIIALDPHTGRVLAMQGGWKYGISEFNRATQAKRQPGSAFKPFVYLAALENGFTPATLVLDAPFVIEDRPGHFWSPTNYSNEYYGPTPLRVGVEKSRNLMTVRLADYIGVEKISDYAARFGIDDDMPPMLSNALGAGETTLLQITAAYGVLVNGGKKITPSFIDRIQDRHGSTIYRHDERDCAACGKLIRWDGQAAPFVPDEREQIADPTSAYQMVSILEGVVQRGTGVRLKELNRPLAGKTGTTNESKDAWFIGFSPDMVVGVFVGFDDPRSMGKRETGSSVALPIFKDFMKAALKDEPLLPFRMPDGIRNVQVNAETGARARPGDSKVIWEAFKVGTEPTDQMYILDSNGINLMRDINSQRPAYAPEIYRPTPNNADTQPMYPSEIPNVQNKPNLVYPNGRYDNEAPQLTPTQPTIPGQRSGGYVPPTYQPQQPQEPEQPVPVSPNTGTGGFY
ncbi:MAG: penicillin-binding protein 1A [Micavibrio sp.]|nr:penicillin-binding protein 1A [Micavibrio sp.]